MSKEPRMSRDELIRQLELRNDTLEDFRNNVSPLSKDRHPHTLAAYREWEEPSLGIRRITSKSHTDINQQSKAKNLDAAQLIDAAMKLFPAIKAAKKGPPRGASPTLGAQVNKLKKDNLVAERQRESMAAQYTRTAARADDLEEKLAAANARLILEQEKNIELTKKINILERPNNVVKIMSKTKHAEPPWTKPVNPQFLSLSSGVNWSTSSTLFPSSFLTPAKRSKRRTVGFAIWHYQAGSSSP